MSVMCRFGFRTCDFNFLTEPIYEKDSVTIQQPRIVCSDFECKDITVDECNPDFMVSGTIGLSRTFTDLSDVPGGGVITSYNWDFGDGTTSSLQNPTHTFPCDNTYTVILTITSTTCPQGSKSISKSVEITNENCCDKNPQSGWKESIFGQANEKMIEYRYDMGTNFLFTSWWDQNFKAKMKNYKKETNIWGNQTWKKKKATLSVDFNSSNVFSNDQNGCYCQLPQTIVATPSSAYKKAKTFKDNLGGFFLGASHIKRIQDTDPVIIDYYVDGVLVATQNTVSEPGFTCE